MTPPPRALPSRLASLGLALAACACSASPPPPGPACGTAPGDWCSTPADGPCGAHPDERSCRADDRCRGMPYRGESVVACMPDGKGFWSNCPAVGCTGRGGKPNAAPATAVVAQLCRNGTYDRGPARIVVWRSSAHEAVILEVRAEGRRPDAGRYYFDPDGNPLANTLPDAQAGTDLGRMLAGRRDALLQHLHEGETLRCAAGATPAVAR